MVDSRLSEFNAKLYRVIVGHVRQVVGFLIVTGMHENMTKNATFM